MDSPGIADTPTLKHSTLNQLSPLHARQQGRGGFSPLWGGKGEREGMAPAGV